MYSYGGYVPILSYRTRTVHTAFELNHHDSNELWATPLIVKWNELYNARFEHVCIGIEVGRSGFAYA